jgi:hypothetical protein
MTYRSRAMLLGMQMERIGAGVIAGPAIARGHR